MPTRASRFAVAILLALLLLVLTEAQVPTDQPFWRPVIMGTEAMIAAEHPLEARAARQALEAGGNAIDAAVAAFYMTTVVEHHQAGIGGDAFILAYLADRNEVVFINGTGPAPALATLEQYEALGGIPGDGPFASDVPGAIAGFDLALERYGTMRYADLLAPAIAAARHGHPLSHWAAGNHERNAEKLAKYPSSHMLLKNDRPFEPGDLLIQSDLARTLETIAREGAAAFYTGSIARQIDAFYKAQGGFIRYDDLASYEAEDSTPIRTTYRGLEVYQSAPNSQGIAMLIALNILEGFDLASMGHNTADYVHVIAEAIKLAFADRNHFIADPRFTPTMPVVQLLSDTYGDARRRLIRMDRAIEGAAPPGDPWNGGGVLPGHEVVYMAGPSTAEDGDTAAHAADTDGRREVVTDGETSSFSIADRYGNLVSVTHSVNGGFGSGMVVEGLGFVLNNRMPYFSLDTDDVNVLIGGKRTRHTINPALALKNGRPYLAWNTPGGDNQVQAMLQAFLALTEFGMNVQQAVEAPTVTSSSFAASNYPQPVGDRLTMPAAIGGDIAAELAARGHHVRVGALQQPYHQAASGAGAVKMVMIDPETGVRFGGAAPAKDNYVIGW